MEDTFHIPVLANELMEAMNLSQARKIVDCTLGGGGHTARFLERAAPDACVFGFDRDQSAHELVKERLGEHINSGRLKLVKAPFSSLKSFCDSEGLTGTIDAICADIGVSSMHLDQTDRGFSFREDGPLDMRMDQAQELDAKSIVNNWSEEDLAKLFWEFGEEPKARAIAKAIVTDRVTTPFETTKPLADMIGRVARYQKKSKKHPATKAFQALRMAVNDELGELRNLIEGAIEVLKPGGRLAIITFHSLEDRIVKKAFVQFTGRHERRNIPKNIPVSEAELDRMVHKKASIIKPFPTIPSDAEVAQNPRARSAKLRTIEKTS